MYKYQSVDRALVQKRVDQFRDQLSRYRAGELGEDEFKQLRLRNGVYEQLHAPMLRVAIPYGLLSGEQLRTLAHIGSRWDRGFGHMTTRQNMQFNWIELDDIPDVLQTLAAVDMHAIQTSGNCIRNTTTDPLAGAAGDEMEDPRPWCEYIRQWANFQPEFNWLPRKFKIAVSGATTDRAAVAVHDIGLRIYHNEDGEVRFRVLVGGGLGRTPHIAKVLHEALAPEHLLSYLESTLRVYNLAGRRDNIYKARIKILVNAMGIDAFRDAVEAEWARSQAFAPVWEPEKIEALKADFAVNLPERAAAPAVEVVQSHAYKGWLSQNTQAHKQNGYTVVSVSLKSPRRPAGDITSEQMLALADLADKHSQGELRSTHDQNLVLAHVPTDDLPRLYAELHAVDLAEANIGTLADMIICPGMDYCSLANASSIAIWDQINARFTDLDYLHDLGDIKIRVSGCMNACAHHHVADIGVLGVEKKGVEWYQLTLGGHSGDGARIGKRLGPAVAKPDVAKTVDEVLSVYLDRRDDGESFSDTLDRIGINAFQEKIYATAA